MIESKELKDIITLGDCCKDFIETWVEPKFGKSIYNGELIFYVYRNYVCNLISEWFVLNETLLTPEMEKLGLEFSGYGSIITYNKVNRSFVLNIPNLVHNLHKPYLLSLDDKDFYLDMVNYYNEKSPLKMTIKW